MTASLPAGTISKGNKHAMNQKAAPPSVYFSMMIVLPLLVIFCNIGGASGLSVLNKNHHKCCNRRDAIKFTASTAALVTLPKPQPSIAAYIDPSTDLPKITKRVFLDIQIGDSPSKKGGQLVIGLFGETTPRLAENFETLCQQNLYAGTTFYRVLSDFTIQGGAIGDASGKTGKSASGEPFEPDNYNIKHTKAGLVSAVRGIGGAVDSRFFINCVDDAAWADDRYAALALLKAMEWTLSRRLKR